MSNDNMRDSGIEWVGEIPAEWELVRIRDAVSTFRGKAQDDNEHYGDEYPSLYAASLSMNGIRQNNIKPIFLSTVEAKRYRLNFDDVLVMEGGATAGTVCQYKGMPENCMHRESVIRLNGHDGKCDNTFLRYYLTYTKNIGYVESISPAVTFMHYTLDKIDNTPLILPPLPEQREIAAFLDKRVSVIDRLMDACRKQIDSLGEYKKSLISECVTGKRRITDADLEGVSVA